MGELAAIARSLGISEDDAATVLDLCIFLDDEDIVAVHGYARDTPRGRDLVRRLGEPGFRARLAMLAEEEGVAAYIVAAIRAG